jgi:hypothetical protein
MSHLTKFSIVGDLATLNRIAISVTMISSSQNLGLERFNKMY